ncbi:GIY-YIG nuclease family protein [Paraburkholderia sp. MPAMCS5]|uniref:GIY-YIG nuclease family protein n=1 Tax=Paraburkholderia sp. MPAMCS5 TaxID=3112563 RepID=UPI002E18A941|nr:GIY-YIG nuclease family protein [Paraburkholderia sp. MPAMCS5]
MMDKVRRKELANIYKLSFPCMGIYSIRNKITGKQLIGKSTNLNGALNRHRLELRLGVHRNPDLLADWRLLGESQFAFEIIDQIKERPEPDFDYPSELDKCMAVWRAKIPPGSSLSYL